MRQSLLILALFATFVFGSAGTVSAAATQHYTIENSGSTDSGTCGNDWATDTFDRDYTISAGQIVEKYKKGAFTTMAGLSPGACENSPGNGHVVAAGITGKFQGELTITVTGGAYNPNASCTPLACQNTAGVIATFFGAGATTTVNTFEFHYSSGKTGEWKNASANRGGNHGDIYTV